jgi:hypothetical protein
MTFLLYEHDAAAELGWTDWLGIEPSGRPAGRRQPADVLNMDT